MLSLIDARYVDSLVKARKVGLPLEMAAQVAGVDPELAATWLDAGRLERKLGARKPLNAYREMCRDFAAQWDRAVPGLITVLRGYLVQHAQKDPKACVAALTSYEREYHARRPRAARQFGNADLDESFLPLDLASTAAAPRSAKFTRTNPDGSVSSAEFSEGSGFDQEVDGETDEALAYFIANGHWPKDAPRPRPASDLEADAVDTEGEPMPDTDMEELALALRGGPPAAETKPGPVAQQWPNKPATPPAAATAGRPGALRRVDEPPALVDLTHVKGGQLVVDVPPAAAPVAIATPPQRPLRRIDPGDR